MNDDLFRLGERIVELAARINIATYEMLTLVAEFDRREGWAEEFTSCADWLAWRTGRMLGTARENVRVAHALEGLPLTSAEMKTGQISYAKVRAMTRVATLETEEVLLEYARTGSAAKLEQIVRGWKHLSRDGELTAEEARHQSRAFSVAIDGDGMYVMRGRLEPEVGAVLMRAIEAASDALYRNEHPDARPRSRQRRADAAGLVAERARQPVAEIPAAFDRRCIPAGRCALRRSLPAGRFAGLGADAGFRRGLLGSRVRWRIRHACRAIPGGGPHRDGHAGEGR